MTSNLFKGKKEIKGLKLKKSTLERFLREVETVAPWFAISGNVTTSCWDKLGKDLDFASTQGTLKSGTKPIWKLVCSCIEDQKCCKVVEKFSDLVARMVEAAGRVFGDPDTAMPLIKQLVSEKVQQGSVINYLGAKINKDCVMSQVTGKVKVNSPI